jgi:hypothetical protein
MLVAALVAEKPYHQIPNFTVCVAPFKTVHGHENVGQIPCSADRAVQLAWNASDCSS